ncbi:hypothetical protein SAMN05421823_108201 [Catalinimonas alkaloidigena]|uniref:Uncharacterized protein n=1 Tax=Catalinimonas alkaloidigena TaxID=1075417 RepID=A0A1G9N898_9BACT|nr:hypothetical protein [Catalinimonas alkaloidigena]SDL82317.1 hypothetical protein SAMN05421823_108201 [Catalinimonas alkaloidigena]
MNEQELQALWQGQAEMDVQLDPPQLVRALRREYDGLAQRIRQRDRLEYGADALVILAFGLIGYFTDSRLTQVGCGVIVVAGCYIAYRLWHVKRYRPSPAETSSLKQQLEATRAYVAQEKRLLERVAYWYLGPLYAGLVLVSLGGDPWWTGLFPIAFSTVLYYYIWKLNQQAARRKFDPLLHRFDVLLQELER